MCGIVAVASFGVPCTMQELLEVLINGLRRLEYRGYDSAGLCVAEQGKNVVLRKTGNVQALHDMAVKDNAGKLDMSANLANYSGIAHTRWATHGVPCDRNAHPQASSPANEFVVVHNGIVTNYRETKTFLENKGHKFVSDTDTEIVAHLLQFLYEEQTRDGGSVTLAQLGLEVMKLVEGASAFAIVSTHFPGELLVAKRGSPLVIGIRYENDNASASVGDEWNSGASRNCQIFAASDTAPIIEHTKRVVFLEDDDVVSIRDGRVHFFNAQRSESASLLTEVRAVKQVEMELSALTKGNFPHYMLKEIHEQVETVVGSMRGRVNFEDRRISMGGFNNNKRVINTARRIVFISCGTSLNACFAVRPLFEELVPDVPVTVENASDFLDRNPKMFRDDVCVFVSQSGETADTLRAMEHCRKFGTVCVGFTNTVGSAISRQTDFGAHLNCGPEIGVASTKAFTSQIVTLTLLALMLCDDSISLAKRRAEIIDGLNALSGSIAKCISMTESRMRELSARVAESKSVLVLGRGFQYATSLEAALKIKELTYVHTEGLNAGELKHGPLALIDEHITVIIICTKDGITDRVRAAVQQIRARNGRPIVLLSEDDPEVEDLADVVIRVPPTVDCLQTVVNIVPLQLLAYHTAVHRGNNVDCPRNLAKSVTVQ